jgi:hypothetical protein
MAEMIFPNSFVRQFSGPLDVDLVFTNTTTRTNYLTSARRYPGQIVSDLQDGKAYKLNIAGTDWEEFGSGVALTPVKFSFTGNGAQMSFAMTGSGLSVDPVSYRVDVGGVLQNPSVDYNISGSNLVFSSAPPNGVNIVVVTSENYSNTTISLTGGFDTDLRAISASLILDGGNTRGSNISIGTNDNFNLSLETSGTPKMTVFNNGNIGINEASPEGKLHVTAGSAGTVTAQTSSVGVFESGGNAYLSLLSPTSHYSGVVMGGPTNPYGSYVSWNHDNLALKVATNHLGGSIQILAGTEQEALRITSTGNVGIGTTSPSEKLTVSGNISASGNIAAQSSTIPVTVTDVVANKTFSDVDTNKVFHFSNSFPLTAIFPSTLSDGFSVAIMNTGTSTLHLSTNNTYKAIGDVITDQYAGAYVYKANSEIFAVGGL